MSEAVRYILLFEAELLFIGFVAGLLGNANRPWWQRAIAGALFFALFYISIPLTIWETHHPRGG